jgi:hypothetical protein
MSSAEPSASQLVPRVLPGNAVTRGSASWRWAVLCLSLILALAAFLRLWQAGESLWLDELHTSWVVSGKLSDVLPRAALGNQSPLYFWGVWLLVQVTGQSEWTLRLPSLLAGIVLPAAVYFLVTQISNLSKENSGQVKNLSYAAIGAALLVAIDPTCIFYAQEARPYAWVMLLAVAELVLLRRLIENPAILWRLALLANSLVLFYLHYTTAIFLAGIVALLPMLVRVTRSPYPTRHLVIDLLLAAALAAPGVVQMSDIFERRTNWEAFVDKPSWQTLLTHVPFTGWAMAGAVVVALALLVPRVLPGNALTRGSASAAPPKTPPAPNTLWYCVLLAAILLPLILSWTVTKLDAAPIYHVRYLVALIPLAAAATCLASLWIPWRIVQTAALVALAGWHLYDGRMLDQFARDGRFLAVRSEDWRGAVAYVNAMRLSERGSKLILDADLIESSEESLRGFDEYSRFALLGIYHVDCGVDCWMKDPADKEPLIDVHQGYYDAQVVFLLFNGSPPRQIFFVRRGNPANACRDVRLLIDRMRRALSPYAIDAVEFNLADTKNFGNVQATIITVKSDFE